MKNAKKSGKNTGWKDTLIEVLKWGLVIFLLWPMVTLHRGQFSLVSVLLGIVLFVIFAGKLMYDYLIMDIMKNRRVSMKKDIVTFIGIVLGAALIVGLVLFSFALFIMQYVAASGPQQ